MNTRFSVLMSIYIKEKPTYLRQCLDSVFCQTLPPDEVVLVEDGPLTPELHAIIDEYKERFPQLKVYPQEANSGLGSALNIGLQHCTYNLVARMDTDDICHPDRFEKEVGYMEEHPDIDLCSCGMKMFGAKDDVWVRDSDPEKVKVTALFFSPILHASSIWKKESFDKYGLRFRQEMVPAEDYDMWCRALSKGLKLVNLPNVLYRYRIHPSQATTQTEKSRLKCREIQQEYMKDVLPTLSKKNREAFPKKKLPIFIANLKDGYFDKIILAKRLVKMSLAKKG